MTTQDQTAAPSAESHPFREGLRDGFPIGLGYFAVAFSIGISARAAGLDAFQAFMASLLNIASAGEYVGFALIAAHASFLEIAIGTLVTNARYLLMSTALSQRFNPKTSTLHRVGVGFGVTDEIFGITIARPGDVVPGGHGTLDLHLRHVPRHHHPRGQGRTRRAPLRGRRVRGEPPRDARHPVHHGMVERHAHHRADHHHRERDRAPAPRAGRR